jgi:SpoVK/Ycf46/Vps4 family AAA+-type ATPase
MPASGRLASMSAAPLPKTSSQSSLERRTSGTDPIKSVLQPPNHEAYLPQAPFYLRSNETSCSISSIAPSQDNGSDPELPSRTRARKELPSPGVRNSFDAGRARGSLPVMPSYRNEYPETAPNVRLLAASAAARSWTDLESGKVTPPGTAPYQQPLANNGRTRTPRKELPQPVILEPADHESKTRPPPRRKEETRTSTGHDGFPPKSTSEAEDSESSEKESDEWQERVRGILRNLPRGVDDSAAKQILNEIVIQGDEVHWDDVAGLDIAKSALKETVVYPFLRPDLFMGLREPARGMLLFGPPGTGKTMLARAVATESKSTFFAISASSLTSKFLGESEKLVRALFALAKLLAPSIIFVDEIDSLLSSRSGSGEHEATRRIKTEFLIAWSDLAKAAAGREQTEKDKEKGDATRVLVLAATNLPWAIDEAARRRFVRRQYIPLPEDHVRKSQIKTLLSHQKHELSDKDMDRLVMLTEGMLPFPSLLVDVF